MLDQPSDKPKTPHHAGHRKRLRERARGASVDDTENYSVMVGLAA